MLGFAELVLVDVGQADVPDLALVLQLDQRADRVHEVDLRVGPVELIERDLVHLQAAEAALAGFAQVLGSAVGLPPARAGSGQTALGGDDQVVGVGMQRLGEQVLADVGSVGVGGVDEVHAELDYPAQRGDRLGHGPEGRPRFLGR